MPQAYYEELTFQNKTFEDQTELSIGTYENCHFQVCDFSKISLKECQFINCDFVECNLQLVNIQKTKWSDVHFRQCKMIGLRFDEAKPMGISVSMEYCNLSNAVF